MQDLSLDCYSDKSNTFYKIMQRFSEAMNTENFNVMETQILVPVKKQGDACTYNINNTIQDLYNPEDDNKEQIEVVSQGKVTILREGDKVINTQNTYKTKDYMSVKVDSIQNMFLVMDLTLIMVGIV